MDALSAINMKGVEIMLQKREREEDRKGLDCTTILTLQVTLVLTVISIDLIKHFTKLST
jgi:hypothetical protein